MRDSMFEANPYSELEKHFSSSAPTTQQSTLEKPVDIRRPATSLRQEKQKLKSVAKADIDKSL